MLLKPLTPIHLYKASHLYNLNTFLNLGLRKYLSYKDVKPYKGGLGLKVLTTSKGLMTDKDAIKKQLGGEVICRVF